MLILSSRYLSLYLIEFDILFFT